MKTCPMCQEVKKLMEEKNINFIDRDIHENENTYRFYCLSKEDSTDSIIFYFNKLKKFKTIS